MLIECSQHSIIAVDAFPSFSSPLTSAPDLPLTSTLCKVSCECSNSTTQHGRTLIDYSGLDLKHSDYSLPRLQSGTFRNDELLTFAEAF